MAMTPLERKAAFKAAVTLRQMTQAEAAKEVFGVTWFHLVEGIAGRRSLRPELRKRFASFIGKTVEEVFGAQDAVGRRRRKKVA